MQWSQLEAAKKKAPPRTLELGPSAFADTWEDKPSAPVVVGLRTIAVLDLAEARGEAARVAIEAHKDPDDPAAIDAYNDALLAWIASRCTCSPDDVREECELWEGMAQDRAKEILSPAGIRLIYDAYERLTIDDDPIQREATDDEIVRLPDAYAAAAPYLHGRRLSRARRLLAFVLDEFADVTPIAEDADG